MKLLLSSAGWEQNTRVGKEFIKLADKIPSEIKVFLVTTASKKDKAWKYVKYTIKELEKVGIRKKNIYIFSLDRKIRANDFMGIDIIYVCGGNTFHYLSRIRKTGLDKKIKTLVKKGVAYFGVSAGSIVAGPNIDIASPFDKNDIKLNNLTGLKLTNVIINPHHTKKDEYLVKLIEKKLNKKILRLTDKQALLIKNGRKTLIK